VLFLTRKLPSEREQKNGHENVVVEKRMKRKRSAREEEGWQDNATVQKKGK